MNSLVAHYAEQYYSSVMAAKHGAYPLEKDES